MGEQPPVAIAALFGVSAACESDEQLIGISVLLVSGGIEVWLALGRPQGLSTCLVPESKKILRH